ncbi:MAG: multicopper oxidase domain-containing protein [Bdellovibrionales bacterium]|nr:multicopper oxidase domain-containing protein [Bdellovibrionales bacterium]
MKHVLKLLLLVATLSPVFSESAQAKTVRYELTIANEKVNLSGKKSVDFSLTVNGGIPAPTLEFTEGDDAEIVVKNRIPNQEASIHWHGILLPPEMDGVPYVNNPPIQPGGEFIFRFKIRQHGTYWYHSHTMTQEQDGVYGAFIIHPKKKTINYDKDIVVVLSDWSDEGGDKILHNLRKDGDYYLYKKGTMRSWLGAIQAGKLGTYLENEWTRMGGMDFSDVGYDAFLINGKKDSQLASLHPGEKVRIRIINAGASSYFYVSLGQSPMKVISADGIDIEPVYAKELLMGMAETYDVLFEVPEHKNYELKATCQDGTGSASGWIGMGEKVPAPIKPFPDQYMSMDHSSHGGGHGSHSMSNDQPMDHSSHSGHQMSENEHSGHEMNHDDTDHSMHNMHAGHKMETKKESPKKVIETLTVDEIKAQKPTTLPKGKVHEVKLVLGGDMRRYIWHINNKAIFEDRTISINEGDIVRFTYENTTMMHHPMHLHGHFFRVLNKYGESSPLKHTVDVPPHMSRTIEFYANEPGDWMLHCHNLFHMSTGMARVVKYSSFTPKPEIAHLQHQDHHLHDPWYAYGMLEAASNHGQAYLRLSQTWNQLEARIETRNSAGKNFSYTDEWEVEGDLFYRRWFGRFFNIVGGGTVFDKKPLGTVGVAYTLPLLFESQALVDHRGKFRLELERRFQWTRTIFTDADLTWRPDQGHEIGKDLEYEVSLMYSPVWSWSAGLMLTERNLGVGVTFQF